MPYIQNNFFFPFEIIRFDLSRYGFIRNGRGSQFTTFMVGTLLIRTLIGRILCDHEGLMKKLSETNKQTVPGEGNPEGDEAGNEESRGSGNQDTGKL